MAGQRRRASAAIGRYGAIGGAALLALLSTGAPAMAQANPYVCNELAVRLARIPKAPPTQADRWSAAITEQKQAIATNQAALSRCGSPENPRCAAFVERDQQMASNLAQLQRERARMGGASASGSPERARIEATMAQMRCGEAPDAARSAEGRRPASQSSARVVGDAPPGVGGVTTAPPRENRGFFSILFGGGSSPTPSRVHILGEDDPSLPPEQEPASLDPGLEAQMSGSYRTLCVRTCDGYFFPISFNAPRGRFRTDANVCSSLCPGTETRLYYHDTASEAEQALSADGEGEALTRLPNAFLYRTRVVPGCACGKPDPRFLPPLAGGMRPGRGEGRTLDADEFPLPRPRPGPDEDPETQADVVAGFTAVPVMPRALDVTASDGPGEPAITVTDAPKVRTVGPKFFSDR